MPNETIFSDCGKLDRLLEGLVAAAMAEKGITHEQAVQEVAAQSPALSALREVLRMKRVRLLPARAASASRSDVPRTVYGFAADPELPKYFSGADLCRMFGVSQKTLLNWIERDLFGEVLVDFLISTDRVQQFARHHAEDYSLRKVAPPFARVLFLSPPQERAELPICAGKPRGRKERQR